MVGTLIRRPLPPVSDFMRTLFDDADATTALATLGVVSGAYVPTLTNVANLDASTSFTAYYIQVGVVVTVTGRFNADATAAASTVTTLGISLPIASNFTTVADCAGVMALSSVAGGVLVANTVTDRAEATWASSTTINQAGNFSFMYVVK